MPDIKISPVGSGNFFDQFDGASVASAPARSPFAGAISSIESGGNYRAVGPETRNGDRALGRYQIMSRNIGPWSKEIFGREVSPTEFIASPEIQDALFSAKFGSYVEKYGPEGAAKAWFAGEKGMANPNARDVLGTSVSDYARKFTNALGPSMAYADEAPARQPVPQAANYFDQFDIAPAKAPEPERQPAPEPPQRKEVGAGSAFVTGLEQGMSFNFGDELRGVSAAAGMSPAASLAAKAIPVVGPAIEPVIGLARLGYEAMTGGGDATKKYEAERDAARERYRAAEEQQPFANAVGNVAGALAIPVGGVMGGATLGARALRGAVVGAGFGGLSGAGEGTTAQERAAKAAFGTGVGGLVGGAGVPVVEGAAKAVTAAVGKPLSYISAGLNPDAAAQKAIGRAYVEGYKADPAAVNRLTAGEVGGPAVVMDALGAPGRVLARSAANISGGARDKLGQTLEPRYENQATRLTNWFRETFSYPDAHAQEAALKEAAKTVNRPAYAKAYADPRGQALWDEGFEQMIQAPVMQQAVRGAMVNAKNEAAKLGFTPPKIPFGSDDAGRLVLKADKDGNRMIPNLQFWDIVKRNVDKINSPESQFWARTLRERLDDLVPSYNTARTGAASFFNAENALEAGQNYVGQNFANKETRAALANMSDIERRLFQDGFVSRLIETLDQIPDRADVLRRIYNSPAAKEKIEIALGRQKAAELETVLRVENIMQQSKTAVTGNSTTAQQLIAAGLAGGGAGAAGGGYLGYDPTASGVLVAALTAGKKGIDIKVATRVAEMLTSNEPKVLQSGVRLLANNKRLMDVLRSADGAAARVGGGQSISVQPSVMQIPAASRAEDQPEIPRPPGQ